MKKILIVDDQDEVRELVAVTLRADNYHIIQASSAMEAIETAAREMPDLIFMDVMMPGAFDGFEAVRRLKNAPETSGLLIIMLTAKGQKSDYERGFAVGADGYFSKPFSPLELIRHVNMLLGDPDSGE